jgi:hypothetical protein
MGGTLIVDQKLTMKDCDKNLGTDSQQWHFNTIGLLQNTVNNDICIVNVSGSPTVKCKDLFDQVMKSANNACVDATVTIDGSHNIHDAYMKLVNFMGEVAEEEINGEIILFDVFSLAKYKGRINNAQQGFLEQ